MSCASIRLSPSSPCCGSDRASAAGAYAAATGPANRPCRLIRFAEKETEIGGGRHMAQLPEQTRHLAPMVRGVVHHVLQQIPKGILSPAHLEPPDQGFVGETRKERRHLLIERIQ